LKEIVDIVSTLLDDVMFRFDKDGLIIEVVDPAHVAMVVVRLPKERFQVYEIDPIECTVSHGQMSKTVYEDRIGLDLDHLKELIRLANTPEFGMTDVIEFEKLSVRKKDEMDLRIVVSMVGTRSEFPMVLLERSVSIEGISVPHVPILDLPANISFKPSDLIRSFRVLELFSDHIFIETEREWAMVGAESDDKLGTFMFGTMEKHSEKQRSLFPMDYLTNMVRSLATFQSMNIHLGTDLPMRMEGKSASGVQVMYLLAPRIEND
jgi:proliferating cell nuclear antigen